ncbi:MAG TPA: GAF domain-containing sensor histidine kinase [Longimicrobiaceae bacterium]|nr:GAF domain-containing sensor histidine kinase [Longimicrobiaceae bacterium]
MSDPRRDTSTPRSSPDVRTRFAFLAETSRCLAESLDFETTLTTAAALALPHFGTWCLVDLVEPDDSIRRVAVVHPDPQKQDAARVFYRSNPPRRDDPLGAPRVIRSRESEFVIVHQFAGGEQAEEAGGEILRTLGAQSSLIVPILARGRTLGAVTFVSDRRRDYDDADLMLAEDLGRRCGIAIDNARLYTEAEEARRASEEALAEAEAASDEARVAAEQADALREEAEAARRQAEEASAAKSAFLATMSHEFRTPLNAILGFADLLDAGVAGPLTVGQRGQLARMSAAGRHLVGLIEGILSFSRLNAGREEVRLEPADLCGLVRQTAEIVLPLAVSRGLALHVRTPQAPAVVATDEGKVRQIVMNLLSNAVRFTDAGEVSVELELDGGAAVLRVRDTGIGIAPEHAERIFEPFSQVTQTLTRHRGGTGLGLAVTRQLAHLLGGDVQLASAPGQGSTFTVRLPAAAAT